MNGSQLELHSRWVRKTSVLIATFYAMVLFATCLSASAQEADFRPEAVSKQRTALYIKGLQVSAKSLETDLNHLAVISEACRIEYGSKTCGLPGKALDSDKLEERYDYYVRLPMAARPAGHTVKIEKRNWNQPPTAASK
jgi:hypothetical protein